MISLEVKNLTHESAATTTTTAPLARNSLDAGIFNAKNGAVS